MNIKPIFIILSFLLFFVSCKQTNEQLLDKAYDLSRQKKYDKAIEIYNEVIKRNNKLQLAYYNRGFVYLGMKDYSKALADFNKVMALQTKDSFIWTYNQDSPFADEEAKAQVPYNDALYQQAQVKFYMGNIKSSFEDFQTLVASNYEEKSNCLLWQGTLMVNSGYNDSACKYFLKAKYAARTRDDSSEAAKMLTTYCIVTKNNR